MHKRTLILFDLDGVLVDTAALHFNAWKSIAAEYGIHIDATIERKLRGLSREKSFETIFGYHSGAQADAARICDRKNQLFLDELETMAPSQISVPNAFKLLDELKSAGAQLVVASGSRNAVPILQKTGLESYFERIIDGTIQTEKKPDPTYYTNILAEMNFAAEQSLLFEDSEACIKAAHQLGIRTIAVNCPPELPASLHIKNLANLSVESTLALIHPADESA